ncbi:MAG: AAA family ATPase [Candidatus Thorarchaeota archaeon]
MQFPLTEINEILNSTDSDAGIISLWGDYGVGKTTLSLQIAKIHALKAKKVLYIYTKPNIPFNKIRLVFENVLEEILDKIEFISITNFEDIFKYIFNLEFSVLNNLKTQKETYDLIIIDSITNLYRLELNREKKDKNFILNYKLNQLLANLVLLNQKYKIELLIVNEISRRTQEGKTYDVESGGSVMHYWVTNSIKIERTDIVNKRQLILYRGNDNKSFTLISMLSINGFK